MKPEVVFGLEGAAWPALLVNASGSILRANSAAMTVFGPVLSGEAPPLSAIWSLDNGGTDGQFLMLWEQAPTATADLNFRVAGKAVVKFTVAICTFNKDGSKWFVLQLLPFVEPVAPPVPVPAAPAPAAPAPAEIPKPAAPAAPADAGGLALKQKLDCALQLARTVSIDFNNALTSVLGHSSLLLGKTEAGHPWRHSLLEVEKSAERAAEIANELADVQPPGKGSAPPAAGQSERGGRPLRGIFPQRPRRENHLEGNCRNAICSARGSTRQKCSRRSLKFWRMRSKPSAWKARARSRSAHATWI